MKEEKNMSIKVVFGEVRFSYAHVFEPTSINGNDEPKYSVSILIPKQNKEVVEKIKKAINEAVKEGVSKFGGKIPPNLKNPLRDGDVERPDDESYTGHYFLNANCKTKPGVIDRYKKPIVDTTEFYSGCYGYASVSFYAFHSAGNKGIACGLNNLMKTREGENLGGRARAEDDFADINIDDNVEEGFYTVDENDDYIF
jgi:hypothetical protein